MAERSSNPHDLLPAETGKRRAARIPPNYHRRQNGFEWGKVRLAWLAALLGIGWVGYALVARDGAKIYSRGPVAKPHAIWDNNCQACHVNFTPISGEAAGMTRIAWHEGVTAKCQTCHPVAAHHGNSLFDAKLGVAEAGCAACHRDHLGHEHDLTRVDDLNCTVCHADLAIHLRPNVQSDIPPPQPPIARAITAFDEQSHAQFRSLQADPGRVKFPHGVHTQAGIHAGKSGDRGREPWTKASFRDPTAAAKYEFNEAGLVQLDCQSCHELGQGKREGEKSAMLPNTGAYYQPVNYERHCAACHHLEIYAEHTPTTGANAMPGGARFATLTLPHRASAEQLQAAVQGFFVNQTLNEPAVREFLNQPLEFPGNAPPAQPPGSTVNAKLQARLANAATLTRHACAFCHEDVAAVEVKPLLRDAAISASTLLRQFPRVLPNGNSDSPRTESTQDLASSHEIGFPAVGNPKIPAVWFQHAKFNHAAHRGVTCAECHPRAYADHLEASHSHRDVLIAGVESCVKCHIPASTAGFTANSAAGTDCVECHRYHGGADPLRGLGPQHKQPAGRDQTIDKFLRGLAPR